MKTVRPILLAVTILLVAFVVYQRSHSSGKSVTIKSDSRFVLDVHSIPVTHNLALGEFEVPSKSVHDVRVAVDGDRLRDPRLTGYFSTIGGQGIQVMLLDEIQHSRFQSHSTPSEFLYESKTAASGSIEVALPHTGTYYLIFDNSSDASIKVKADVTVHYETVQVDSGARQNK